MQLQKYEGSVYLAQIDPLTGAAGPYIGPIECNDFTPSRTEPQTETYNSHQRDNMYGQVIHEEITTPGTPGLQMGFLEQPAMLFGVAFAASPTEVSVAAAAVTGEEVVIPELGAWVPLSKRNLATSPAPVFTTDAGTPVPLVAGEDYEINHRLGWIRALPGSALIDAGDTIIGGFSHSLVNATEFIGETVTSANFKVFFDGKNRISKKDFQAEYFNVLVRSPTDIYNLLSDELITLTLNGTPITPSGQPGPYRLLSAK